MHRISFQRGQRLSRLCARSSQFENSSIFVLVILRKTFTNSLGPEPLYKYFNNVQATYGDDTLRSWPNGVRSSANIFCSA